MAATKRYGLRTPDGSTPNAMPLALATLAGDVEGRLGAVDDRSVVPRITVVRVSKSVDCSIVPVLGWVTGGATASKYVTSAVFPVYVSDGSNNRLYLPGFPAPANGSESLPGACTGPFGRADLLYSRAESLWFVQQAGQTLTQGLTAGQVVVVSAQYLVPTSSVL